LKSIALFLAHLNTFFCVGSGQLDPSFIAFYMYTERRQVPRMAAVPRDNQRPESDPRTQLVVLVHQTEPNPVFRVRMDEADQFEVLVTQSLIEGEFRVLGQFQGQRASTVITKLVMKRDGSDEGINSSHGACPDSGAFQPVRTARR